MAATLDELITRFRAGDQEAARELFGRFAGQMLALAPRHRDELAATLAAIVEARRLLAAQLDRHALQNLEVIAERLRDALDHLGCLGGQLTPDDVIGRIFASFCIGK